MPTVLYIHGMGGGGDSRIPSILRERIPVILQDKRTGRQVSSASSGQEHTEIRIVVRTYDFDPERAAGQIAAWVEELRPSLVIGESLGALQALRIRGVPHLFVSPSLNATLYFNVFAVLSFIPGVTPWLDRIYRPREGDRQPLHFTFRTLWKYRAHRRAALANTPRNGSGDAFFAFFGERDHYRRSGVVSVRTWRRYFGENTWRIYPGTHFMEAEFVESMLIPKIFDMLDLHF